MPPAVSGTAVRRPQHLEILSPGDKLPEQIRWVDPSRSHDFQINLCPFFPNISNNIRCTANIASNGLSQVARYLGIRKVTASQ